MGLRREIDQPEDKAVKNLVRKEYRERQRRQRETGTGIERETKETERDRETERHRQRDRLNNAPGSQTVVNPKDPDCF